MAQYADECFQAFGCGVQPRLKVSLVGPRFGCRKVDQVRKNTALDKINVLFETRHLLSGPVPGGRLERGAHAPTTIHGFPSVAVHPTNMSLRKLNLQLTGPFFPFPLARVAWVLFGLAGQYLRLEGGGCYPTPNQHTAVYCEVLVTRPELHPNLSPRSDCNRIDWL